MRLTGCGAHNCIDRPALLCSKHYYQSSDASPNLPELSLQQPSGLLLQAAEHLASKDKTSDKLRRANKHIQLFDRRKIFLTQ